MLELLNIHKLFGDARDINEVRLRLLRGHVYTLEGCNDFGKVILINVIFNFLRLNGGHTYD